METMRSHKLYACVETNYTESNGDDVDSFVGTYEECLTWMHKRYNTVAGDGIDPDKDMCWIEDDCDLGHAVIQDNNGRFRYEWHIIIPYEKRGEEKRDSVDDYTIKRILEILNDEDLCDRAMLSEIEELIGRNE